MSINRTSWGSTLNLSISGKLPLILFLLFSGSYAQDVFLRITTRGEERIKVSVLDFLADEEMQEFSKNFTEILKKDLKYSLFIYIIDSSACSFQSVVREKEIDYPCWAKEAVQVVVWGRITAERKEAVEINMFVQSVAFRHRILKRVYRAKREDIRRLAHTAADDIHKQLTGEWGIANTRILFVSNRTGHKEVYICDYDGAHIEQLTDFNSITLFPAISPDNSRILFTSFNHGLPKLYITDPSNLNYHILAEFQGQNGPAAFSPDGKRIALTLSKDGNSEIYVMDLRTRRLERLTYNWGIDTSPCWSPSGQQLAFTSDMSGSPQIYIMDAVGTNIKRLTFIGNYNDQPAWSPKGDKIAYCSRVENRFNIVTVGLDGSSPILLTAEGDNQSPSWSPDGYYITFSSNRQGGYKLYQMDYQGGNIRCISHGGEDFDPVWTNRYDWKFAQ